MRKDSPMRTIVAVFLTVAALVAVLLVVLGTDRGAREQQGASAPAELPDLVGPDSEEEKRSFLIEYARDQLKHIVEKFDDSLLARANCEVVEGRLEQDYANADAAPMMIGSSLVPLEEENQYFFFVWCFNPHREHDAIVLVGKTPEGTTVRVRYESNPKVKAGALVGTFAGKTRLVSLEELLKAGKVLKRNGEIEVLVATTTIDAPVVPDLPTLAVAVHDRNGRLSNFVPVRRDNAINEEKGTFETVKKPTHRVGQGSP